MRNPVATALLASLSGLALGQAAVPVYVQAAPKDDPAGTRLAFQVREQIRGSRSLQLSPSPQQATLQLYLATFDPDGKAKATVFSAVITIRDKGSFTSDSFWSHTVGQCLGTNVANCAGDLVAMVDQASSDFQSQLRAIQSQQPKK